MFTVSTGLKNRLSVRAGEFVTAILLVQPLLDVLSFFMKESGATVVTTALRLVLLVAVSLYGFLATDRKELYAAAYALIGGFWLLHMLNCLRTGYADPVGDTAEYLKLVQFPLWTMSFVTLFRKRDDMDRDVLAVLTVNFAVILLVIGLSYLTGHPAYTYEFPGRDVYLGVLGWFGVPNAQSAILCLLVPSVVLWGLRSDRLEVLAPCCVLGYGLLYFTGTRLTYFTALITAAAFLVMIVICRKPLILCVPMLAVLVLFIAFKWASPMEERQQVTAESFAVYQEKIDAVMGDDSGFVPGEGQEIPPAVKAKIKRVYETVYGQKGVYGEMLLGDLIDRFGVEKVMEEMDYSVSPSVLNNSRIRKLKALTMVWEEQDFLTHLLGMEYEDAVIGGRNYDPENDFPALFFYTGYLGTALYAAFLLGLFLYGAASFFRRFPALLTVEFCSTAMLCVLALGAAQLSGQVLRKPNVTVYFSLAAAQFFVEARETPPVTRLRPGHKPNPAVHVKKIG